jgi:hypothetical protein
MEIKNNMDRISQKLQRKLSHFRTMIFVYCLFLVTGIVALIWVFNNFELLNQYLYIKPIALSLIIITFIVLIYRSYSWLSLYSRLLKPHKERIDNYDTLLKSAKQHDVSKQINLFKKQKLSFILNTEKSFYLPKFRALWTSLNKSRLHTEMLEAYTREKIECTKAIDNIRTNSPLLKVQNKLSSTLAFLKQRKKELVKQWDLAYSQFSWWNKIKYSTGPDFSELDTQIRDAETLNASFKVKHAEDVHDFNFALVTKDQQLLSRLSSAQKKAEELIDVNVTFQGSGNKLLQQGLWCGALSIPLSVSHDILNAGNVYDSLRSVNSNFSGMSDADIWWETLWMPADSLTGLASLTKGAYFEQLVANDTGGQLHEHFNHPDTDIVIDGVAYQIKATSSESYVNSVPEDIPVISTSEVALATGSIDGGMSNEDLNNQIELALGGTVVDGGDTASDAILMGVGGLGFFATLNGLNHAAEKYNNGGDGVEALFAGAGVAIKGTAKAMVDAGEMVYNVATSRPMRFMGRVALKGLVKLDKKITGQ